MPGALGGGMPNVRVGGPPAGLVDPGLDRGQALNPSLGGQQNLPNLFGQGPSVGFGGYNAGMANQGASWMSGMLGGQNQAGLPPPPAGAYGGPVGSQQNPYSNWNLTAMSPNQGLGQLPSQMGFLQSIAGGQGAGAPVNQLPAWQSMVGAQNYNIQQGADSLAEQFNNGGGLFSTAYGNAQGQYQEQARLGQNSQLTAASTQAMQQAMQNQMGAAGQLSGQGYGALGQLSNQGYGAAQQAAQYQYGAASQQAQQANQGALANMQNQQFLQSLGLQGAGQMGQLGLANMNMGNQFGNSQLLANQNQLTAAYQNWYNSQPQNNPLLSMMYAGATGYPQLQQNTYNPGMLGSLLGGLGGLAGGIGAMGGSAGLAGLLPLLGLSDRRLKENITRIGKVKDVSVYRFNFPGEPTQTGVMAQQVSRRHPEAVIRGDKSTPWLVNYTKLAQALGVK